MEKETALADEPQTESGLKKTGAAGEPAIPGINITAALARFGNDRESYLRILDSFVTHAPDFILAAQTSMPNIEAYRIAVHGIKGSGRNIGADTLGSMAEALEHAAARGDTDFITANTVPFVEAANTLIATAAAFLKNMT